MTKKMKVAWCIPALMRTYKRLYQNHLDNLIGPNDVDIFVYTSNYNDQLDEQYDPLVFEEEIRSVYKERLKGIQIVSNEFIDDAVLSSREDAIPNISMARIANGLEKDPGSIKRKNDWINFYRTLQCNEMIKSYEKENDFEYDVVIKMRPDLILDKKLELDKIEIFNTFLYTFGNNKDEHLGQYKEFGEDYPKDFFYSISTQDYLNTQHYINTPFLNMFVFATRKVFDIFSQTYFYHGDLTVKSASAEGTKRLTKLQEHQIRLWLMHNKIEICNITDLPSHIVRDACPLGQPLFHDHYNIFKIEATRPKDIQTISDMIGASTEEILTALESSGTFESNDFTIVPAESRYYFDDENAISKEDKKKKKAPAKKKAVKKKKKAATKKKVAKKKNTGN